MMTRMWFWLACVCALAVAKEAVALSEYDGSTVAGDYAISSAVTLRLLAEKSSAAQFAGSTFTLTADIDLAGEAWTPISTFKGVFNGGGHTISNLDVNLPTTDDIGLFKILENAIVTNLAIRGGRVEGRCRVGGLAGRINSNATIADCTTDLEIVANDYEAGGIVGYTDNQGTKTFTRCRALGPVTGYGNDRVGGLIGKTGAAVTIDSCYTSGAVTGYGIEGYVGGLIGVRNGATVTITNSYSVSSLLGNFYTQRGSTDDDIVGNGIASNVKVLAPATILDCFPKNITHLAKRGNGLGTVEWVDSKPVATAGEGSVFIRWDGEIAPEGDYNERTLYAVFGKPIATEADLRAVTAKGFFKQTNDIEMTSSTAFNGLHENPRFQGEYDGGGFVIKNLNIASGDNTGLFRVTQGAILKDIHLVGGEVSGGQHVGALVGWQFGGLVERCSASTVVRASAVHAAGLIGRASSRATIRECCASGPVISKADYVGGLISYTYDDVLIEDCYARGDVKGTENVGGFIGGADYALTIKNCYSTGKVACGVNPGGFFARNDGGKTVTGCVWDSTKAGQTRSTYGTSKSTAEMFGSSAYTGWDEAVWNFPENGYPSLKGMPKLSPTLSLSGCGTGTAEAVDNGDGTWTFTAVPAEGSWFVRWGGLATAEATESSLTIACDGTEAPVAIFGTVITTLDQFKKIWSNPDTYGCYRLAVDLDFANTGVRMSSIFEGIFDGGGHTISNFVLNLPSTDDVGLFSSLRSATVKNLAVRGGRIEGRNRVGGIATYIRGSTVIENCTTDLEVVANGYEAGGIVGYIDGAGNNRLTRCRALGPVTAYDVSDRAGGLIAKCESSITIDTCYASGAISGYGTTGHVGGLIGLRTGGTATIRNSYSVSRLLGNYITQATESTDDDIVGSGLSSVSIDARPTILEDFPKNIINLAKRGNGSGTVAWDGATPVATAAEGSVFIRWDGEMPTEENYNERTLYAVFGKAIASEADLRAVIAKGFFKQTADIEMTSSDRFYGLHYSPRFQGEYDGQGFAIKNLNIASGDNGGLFRVTQGAILKDIHLVGGEVSGGQHVGALIGAQNGGVTERCSASTAVRATGRHAGGLIGRADYNATIRECCALGPVDSTADYVGGLISYTSYTALIENCYARGDVRGTEYVGGFIGGADHALTITNCYSSGCVRGAAYTGGFFARSDGGKTVTGCVWDSTKAGQTRSTYGTSKPTAEMFGESAYTGWDAAIWDFSASGYPTLKAMSKLTPTPIVSGCGTGTVSATQNTDGTWTFTAVPAEGSWFVRWGGLTTGEKTENTITLACDNSEAPVAIFGTVITTLDQFKKIWSDPDILGYYRLEADLDLKGDGVRMTKDFGGLFDGNGHTISNLVLKLQSTDDVGLFAFLRNATVKNLAIRGGYIEGYNRVGGLVGRVKGGTVIENCTTDLEVVANGFEGGGIVGVIDNTGSCRLTRCRALGPVTGYNNDERVGGLIGRSDYAITIDSCYASGAVTGYGTLARVGGLIGWRTGGTATIRNSYSVSRLQGNYLTQATESTEDDIVGNGVDDGVTVESTATIIDDLPKGTINLAKRGNGSGTVAWDEATGKPVATAAEGSVFIRWDGEMPTEENYNERTLYAVFGKAVASEADLRAVTAKGFFKQTADIEMTSDMAPGLHYSPRFQGEYDGDGYSIKNLALEGGSNNNVALFRATQGAVLRNIILDGGKVAGRHQVAPLVGWMYGGLVERCSANMEVAGTGNHAAGLVGRSEGYATVRQSRALGSVTGSQYVGGLISYMSGTAYTYDCYSRCSVTASANAGGFIGATSDDNSVVHSCFVVGRVTGTGSGVGGFWGTYQHRTQLWNLIWKKEESGQTYSYHGSPLPTDEMKKMEHYAAWDDEVWRKVEGEYPELWAFSGQEDAPRFTVKWVNYDGTELAQKAVRAGVVPRYPGAMPIKPAANGKFYNFTGWSPEPTAVTGEVTYTACFQAAKNRNWMIVDLVTGGISYAEYDVATATNVFNTLEYKTKKMVFRRVAAGNNYYVKNGECTAQMASSYYIGLFEVTAAQYALMQSGNVPASYAVADYRTQGSLNRSAVRGITDSPETFGAGITATSPLGRFNARVRKATGNAALTFDLPTEAMWEVAARAADAGDETRKTWRWYFGEDETLLPQHAFIAKDSSADDYGITSGLRVPGSRLANGWGLFDMYGNARELCLDGANGEDSPQYTQEQYTQAPSCRNGNQRTRGGSFKDDATRGRSSWRTYHDAGAYDHCGIRLARLCAADEEMVPEEEVTIPAETTGGTEVNIPMTWFERFPAFVEKFGDDFAAAAVKPTGKTTANGSPMSVWHDFVAGTDPTDEKDVFTAKIEIVDGELRISWEPNLNANGDNVRVYRKLGKAKLSDSEWLPADNGHNFFMVTVEMPTGAATSDVPGRVAPSGTQQ